MMSFITELKRRNVFKVGVVYAIVGWLLIQIASILFTTFDAPHWVMRVFTIVVILGFPLALILAWAYEMTPEGIKATSAAEPGQNLTRAKGRRLNYIIVGLVVLAAAFILLDNYVFKGISSSTVAPSTTAGAVTETPTATQPAPMPATPTAVAGPVRRHYQVLGLTKPLDSSRLSALAALSPDGMQLVYAVNTEAGLQLQHRDLNRLSSQPLPVPGTIVSVIFSPDGQWVGVGTVNPGALYKISLQGGPPQLLAEGFNSAYAGHWATDGFIYFTALIKGSLGLYRVREAGGDPEPIPISGELANHSHSWPYLLPDHSHLLFTVSDLVPVPLTGRVALLDLNTGKARILIQNGYNARYASTGHIVFMRSGSLWAVPFDVQQLKTTGAEVPVVNGVELAGILGLAVYTFSNDGLLANLPGGDVFGVTASAAGPRQLVWVDRQGKVSPVAVKAGQYVQPRLSPDDKQAALTIGPPGNSDIWTYDFARGTLSKRTFGGDAVFPLWSPDGDHLAYTFFTNPRGLAWTRADGAGQPQKLVDAPRLMAPTSFTPDGTRLIYSETLTGPRAIHVLSMKDEHTDRSLLAGNILGVLSPDGKWLAYESDETGRVEIYVRPYPNVDDGKWQISTDGGLEAHWRGDGKEMYYRTPSLPVAVMAVPVETRPRFQAGIPVKLFQGDFYINTSAGINYDVTADGQRFLMMKLVEETGKDKEVTFKPTNLVVVENWFEELKRLAPPAK